MGGLGRYENNVTPPNRDNDTCSNIIAPLDPGQNLVDTPNTISLRQSNRGTPKLGSPSTGN